MQEFKSDGVEIAYIDEGEGPPTLLIHGFASNLTMNWMATGWVKTLKEAGRRVIAFDNRGHGKSEKLYELDAYGAPLMAQDARRLLDHLKITAASVIGYSMGARIAAFLALNHPQRVKAAVFGGLGINMVRGMAGTRPIAHALEVPALEDVKNPAARTFRAFAEQTGSDLRALAACIRSSRDPITKEDLARLEIPVLVAVGERDVIGGSAVELAKLIPNAQVFEIRNKDHMKAVADQGFKKAVLEFLEKNKV